MAASSTGSPTAKAAGEDAPFRTRRRARTEKTEAVLRVAARLFLDVGYRGATLSALADRLGITKPALYNYFRSKEDILAACYRVAQAAVEDHLRDVEQTGGTGLDRLRALIRAYALGAMDDFAMCLIRLDDRDLSPEGQVTIRARKRELDRMFRTTIEAGIADGSIRPCDARLAAFAVAGALNWIGQWYRPASSTSPETIADEFAEQLSRGLASGS